MDLKPQNTAPPVDTPRSASPALPVDGFDYARALVGGGGERQPTAPSDAGSPPAKMASPQSKGPEPSRMFGNPAGLIEPGNLDISHRPIVHNPDGSISTELSISIGLDGGREALIPTVVRGKRVSTQEAIDHFRKTGEHLGIFSSVDAANKYAEALHGRPMGTAGPAGGIDYARTLVGGEGKARPAVPTYGAGGAPSAGGGRPPVQMDTPLNSVFTASNMGDPDKQPGADWTTHYKAGHVDDPEDKIRLYAAARFPGVPFEIARQRYGIHEGDIVFKGDDGKIYKEQPDGFWEWAKSASAEGAAYGPEILLGGAGGVFGGVPGAMGGAAAGEAARVGLGDWLYGADPPASEYVSNALTSGVMAGAGELVFKGLGAAVNKARAMRAGCIGRMARTGLEHIDKAEMAKIREIARDVGVDLAVSQASDSSELIQYHKLLADMPETANRMAKFQRGQQGQVQQAFDQFLEGIAPHRTPLQTGEMVTGAARGALRGVDAARGKAAAPLYKKAFDGAGPVDLTPVLSNIDALIESLPPTSPPADVLKGVRRWLVEPGGAPIDDLHKTHEVKMLLDRLISGKMAGSNGLPLKHSLDRRQLARLMEVKESLVKQMDAASPYYQEARELYAKLSPAVEGTRQSIAGEVARLEGDATVKAPSRIFSNLQARPDTIAKARKLISAVDPDAWNAALRMHFEEAFENIKTPLHGTQNLGGWLHKKMLGDARQRQILKAAMTPEQWQTTLDLFEVFRRTGLTVGKESATATRQEVLRMERAGRGLGAALLERMQRPLRQPGMPYAARLSEASLSKYRHRMVEIMLDPTGKSADQLAKLKQLKPRSKQFLQGVGALLGIWGAAQEDVQEVPRTVARSLTGGTPSRLYGRMGQPSVPRLPGQPSVGGY